eukprot:TRINITY_DN2045_c0_g1_i1.p1 TRINITY_DN2045_c0_g1~~TRINITY_DN2045_c0_g1_i1.p1  ORF type:complete len:256 (-),score=41.82 TRINITY_DN2045_c0_g1_i1:194-961(-)
MNTIKRSVKRVIKSIEAKEGAGFTVHRPFPISGISHIDPFLLLDHFGPINAKPGEAVGAPWHPHRGFETVSYLLSGEFQHQDSLGNKGTLRTGDVQWMTAGSGIIHDEGPSDEFKKTGGISEGFQIWVNLPQKHKMIDPYYQEVPKEQIPEVKVGNATIKVIAGKAYGVEGAVKTLIPIYYLDCALEKGDEIELNISKDLNTMIYVYRGSGEFGGTVAKMYDLVVYDSNADEISVRSSDEGLKFLVLAGVSNLSP